MAKYVSWCLLPFFVFGLTLYSISTSKACLIALPPQKAGQENPVKIASESAIIIWDEKAKKQHFIRRASFESAVPKFGFLVPTPAQPELAEAPNELFSTLEDWTKPEVQIDRRYFVRIKSNTFSAAKIESGKVPVVEVLAQFSNIGGYDATVLKANDSEALGEWLGKHGYVPRPSLKKWLDPYVKAKWIITAFQIAKDEGLASKLATQAVRMSFTTERPFFPYSEPEDSRGEGGNPKRLLQIFMVAPHRMIGSLDERTASWEGKTEWAGRLNENKSRDLVNRLPPGVGPGEGAWLTEFIDNASPRPGTTDLFFSPSRDQSEVRRPPIINMEYSEGKPPKEVLGIVIFVGIYLSPLFILRWLQLGGRLTLAPSASEPVLGEVRQQPFFFGSPNQRGLLALVIPIFFLLIGFIVFIVDLDRADPRFGGSNSFKWYFSPPSILSWAVFGIGAVACLSASLRAALSPRMADRVLAVVSYLFTGLVMYYNFP